MNFFGILNAAGHASPYVNVPLIPALAGTHDQRDLRRAESRESGAHRLHLASDADDSRGSRSRRSPTSRRRPDPTTGGTAITITGTNFQAGATVQIGGAPATGVIGHRAGQHQLRLAARNAGSEARRRDEPGYDVACTLPNGFTYVAPLVLSTVTPLVAAPGVAISIAGSGIQPGASLLVGGAAVTPLVGDAHPDHVHESGRRALRRTGAGDEPRRSNRVEAVQREPDDQRNDPGLRIGGWRKQRLDRRRQLLRGLDRAGQRSHRSVDALREHSSDHHDARGVTGARADHRDVDERLLGERVLHVSVRRARWTAGLVGSFGPRGTSSMIDARNRLVGAAAPAGREVTCRLRVASRRGGR